MLKRIVEMFRGSGRRARKHAGPGRQTGTVDHAEAFVRLNALAPLASEARQPSAVSQADEPGAAPSFGQSIVYREAVLGTDQRVAGYAFSLRYEVNQRVRASSTHIQRLYDQVLLRNLQAMEIQRLLGHRLAFVDVSASSLAMPLLDALEPNGIVYVVGSNAQLVEQAEFALENLARLRARGYRIGLHGAGVDHPDMTPFLACADFVFVDVGGNDIPTIRNQVEAIVRQAPSVRLVATRIQTQEEFSVCRKLPFACYQGAFITSRRKWDNCRIDTGRVRIVELLNRLRGDVDMVELAGLIKSDPGLSFKLLRYINSPGVGLVHRIGTLDQALVVLGQRKLHRWLTLLLYTNGNVRGLDAAILENALVRARLAELAAEDSLSPDERDELFVAGAFSLLDVVLGLPMAAVLEQVNLPPRVNDALLRQTGPYAPYLELAIACEQPDGADVAALSQAIGLDSEQVNNLHVEAMIWAHQMSE